MELPIHKTLKDQVRVELDKMQPQDHVAVRALFNTVISEGQTYPQSQPLTEAEFAAYWMSSEAFVVTRSTLDQKQSNQKQSDQKQSDQNQIDQNQIDQKYKTREVLGAFYLKPNFPGRCSHICNAGFIVQPALRAKGIGRLMGEAMLTLAIDRGYRAVMFNLVFATNRASLQLWDSLGFTTIGRIPQAVHLPNGDYADALMLWRSLLNPSIE